MNNEIEKTKRKTLLSCEKGAGFSEYLVLLVIVVVAGIAMWQSFSKVVDGKTDDVEKAIKDMK